VSELIRVETPLVVRACATPSHSPCAIVTVRVESTASSIDRLCNDGDTIHHAAVSNVDATRPQWDRSWSIRSVARPAVVGTFDAFEPLQPHSGDAGPAEVSCAAATTPYQVSTTYTCHRTGCHQHNS
jgi:hypothetical protein